MRMPGRSSHRMTTDTCEFDSRPIAFGSNLTIKHFLGSIFANNTQLVIDLDSGRTNNFTTVSFRRLPHDPYPTDMYPPLKINLYPYTRVEQQLWSFTRV